MKKIVFWGDSVLSGPYGYAELLVQHIFLHHPHAHVSTAIYNTDLSTGLEASREASLHVIGKAPHRVLIGFGGQDLASGKRPEEIFNSIHSILQLLLQKTQSHISLVSLISSFYADDILKELAQTVNGELKTLLSDRVEWIDLDSRVHRFLNQHRKGPGEKHALHFDAGRLTPMGKLFLAHHAYHLVDWPPFQ